MKLEIRPVQIPMTPDRTLLWERCELPDGAIVLRSPECKTNIVNTLLDASRNPIQYRTGRIMGHAMLGSGALGIVYRQQQPDFDIAVKLFDFKISGHTELHQGLSGLRANVAIAEGVRKLANDNRHVFASKPPQSEATVHYALKTPTYFAAILYPETVGCNAWAMSFEPGSHAESFHHQPPYNEYAPVLDDACRCVNLEPTQIEYDSYYNIGNLLLRPSSEPNAETDLVKIDNYAQTPLDF